MLSIPHIIVLLLVALVVLGPDKLPEVARTMGKAMAELRRVTGDFRYQIEGEMRELDRQARTRELGQQKDIYEYQPPAEPSIAPPAMTPAAESAVPHAEFAGEPPAGTAPEVSPAAAEPAAPEHAPAAVPSAPPAAAAPEKPGEPHPA